MANTTYKLITPKFRAAFCNLWEPKPDDKGVDKWGVTMLFAPGEKLEEIKAMANQLMTEKFGADKAKWPKGFKNLGVIRLKKQMIMTALLKADYSVMPPAGKPPRSSISM